MPPCCLIDVFFTDTKECLDTLVKERGKLKKGFHLFQFLKTLHEILLTAISKAY